jgi:two-component system, OmpR family, phosphate regulon sensor histidine kinase PhoR
MKRLNWLAVLMLVTILAIAGFQIYWLNENYKKEANTLEFRTHVAFREAINKLQAKKLKLDKIFTDSIHDMRVEIKRDFPAGAGIHMIPDENLVTMVNALGEKVTDSLRKKRKATKGMVITMNKTDMLYRNDTLKEFSLTERGEHPAGIVRFLYGVDSLQEPINLDEIDSAYGMELKRENIDINYEIKKDDSVILERTREDELLNNKVTVGFAHPVTYELILGNAFGYIIKRLSSPILFSIFLVGVTILSFVLLYRNLLHQRRLAVIKNEFISNITHELKTPIATVGVAIEALRNFNAINDTQRTKEYLDISQNELHRLSLLVDKVLKLSMFEKKEIELQFDPVNLKDIVNEVVDSMKLQTEKYHASVSVEHDGDLVLQGDRLHLLSVVFNLLDNSLKYSNGDPIIRVKLSDENSNVVMSIRDNGIGIPPEYQGKLFEKFFRVPSGNTHNAKGYGVGLSYVSHVVEKHKGTITVDSNPGSGTEFIITLPKEKK